MLTVVDTAFQSDTDNFPVCLILDIQETTYRICKYPRISIHFPGYTLGGFQTYSQIILMFFSEFLGDYNNQSQRMKAHNLIVDV